MKDVLAFLRVLENPRDEVSWYRILLLLPGIGDATARAAMRVDGERCVGPGRVRHATRRRRARATAHARARRRCSARFVPAPVDGSECRGRDRAHPALYDDLLRERYDNAEPRLADLDQLQHHRGGLSRSRGVPLRARAGAAAGHAGPRRRRREPKTTCWCSAPCTRRRARSGTRSSSSGRWTAGSRRRARWRTPDELGGGAAADVRRDHARKESAGVVYPLNAYSSRRGADYSLDQLSRFIDRGVRETMQRVTVGLAPAAVEPEARARPAGRPEGAIEGTVRRLSRKAGSGQPSTGNGQRATASG